LLIRRLQLTSIIVKQYMPLDAEDARDASDRILAGMAALLKDIAYLLYGYSGSARQLTLAYILRMHQLPDLVSVNRSRF
jgi:hypothetical protein